KNIIKIGFISLFVSLSISCVSVFGITPQMEAQLESYTGRTGVLKHHVPMCERSTVLRLLDHEDICTSTLKGKKKCDGILPVDADDLTIGTEFKVVRTYIISAGLAMMCETTTPERTPFTITMYPPDYYAKQGFKKISLEDQTNLVVDWKTP
ncbi:hypothetical protein KAI87_09915, partial [Myxococcota bacterium]|nr:hypothetical protein [Myxococcota bacterium]